MGHVRLEDPCRSTASIGTGSKGVGVGVTTRAWAGRADKRSKGGEGSLSALMAPSVRISTHWHRPPAPSRLPPTKLLAREDVDKPEPPFGKPLYRMILCVFCPPRCVPRRRASTRPRGSAVHPPASHVCRQPWCMPPISPRPCCFPPPPTTSPTRSHHHSVL
jgi:hypothetical protein